MCVWDCCYVPNYKLLANIKLTQTHTNKFAPISSVFHSSSLIFILPPILFVCFLARVLFLFGCQLWRWERINCVIDFLANFRAISKSTQSKLCWLRIRKEKRKKERKLAERRQCIREKLADVRTLFYLYNNRATLLNFVHAHIHITHPHHRTNANWNELLCRSNGSTAVQFIRVACLLAAAIVCWLIQFTAKSTHKMHELFSTQDFMTLQFRTYFFLLIAYAFYRLCMYVHCYIAKQQKMLLCNRMHTRL